MTTRGSSRRPAGIAWLSALACATFPMLGLAQATPTRPVKPAEAPIDLRVQNVATDISVIAGAGGNVVVWSGADGVVLIDSGRADATPVLVEAVTRVAPGTVRFVLNTHGHADHTGGNETFARKGAVVIGHESLREHAGRDPAAPTVASEGLASAPGSRPMLTLTDTLALHLNGDRIDAVHVADAHTAADIVVRWNEADIVALGDIYWSNQFPFIDAESGGSLAGTVAAIEAALARSNARTVIIPGHGPVSNRAELVAYRDMLVAVGRKVRQAVERGEGIENILAARPTAEFDARFGRPGAAVTPDEFIRSVYRDLAPKRPGR